MSDVPKGNLNKTKKNVSANLKIYFSLKPLHNQSMFFLLRVGIDLTQNW